MEDREGCGAEETVRWVAGEMERINEKRRLNFNRLFFMKGVAYYFFAGFSDLSPAG